MPEESITIDAGVMLTGMGGGLALFLFGMQLMTDALKVVAGASMKNLLARLTANRFLAVLAGTLITAVIQSSSVTTVLVVGFVTAGIMNLTQSIGVIIGANIGTTVTGQTRKNLKKEPGRDDHEAIFRDVESDEQNRRISETKMFLRPATLYLTVCGLRLGATRKTGFHFRTLLCADLRALWHDDG